MTLTAEQRSVLEWVDQHIKHPPEGCGCMFCLVGALPDPAAQDRQAQAAPIDHAPGAEPQRTGGQD